MLLFRSKRVRLVLTLAAISCVIGNVCFWGAFIASYKYDTFSQWECSNEESKNYLNTLVSV